VAGPALLACTIEVSPFKIDRATGAGTLIGSTGFVGTNSLACDSSGKLYSVAVKSLIRIDPQTGAGTSVKQLQPVTDIRDLAFSPEKILFGIRNGGGPTGTELGRPRDDQRRHWCGNARR
jgi:hypothetical protein